MASAFRKFVGAGLGLALLSASVTSTAPAHADSVKVSGDGKGIVGGALLGGEIGMFTLGAAGAHDTWMYLVIPGALAVGGGVGGYFIEKNADAQIPMYMLAGGMALVIPALVVTISATAYRPNPVSEDATPADAKPASEPPKGEGGAGAGTGTTAPAAGPTTRLLPRSPRIPRALPTALLNFGDEPLQFAVPAVRVAPMYSVEELAKFGGSQRYEVTAPVVAVAF